MPAAVDTVAGAVSGPGASSLTTGSTALAGANRAVIGVSAITGQTGTSFKHGGSGGTDLAKSTGDEPVFFGVGSMAGWSGVPGPAGATTTFYAGFSGSAPCAMAAVELTGVDQTIPHGTPQEGADNEYFGGTSGAPSITVPGLTVGQLVIAVLAVTDAGDKQVTDIVAGANTTLLALQNPPNFSGAQMNSVAIFGGVAAGTSLTLNATITTIGDSGFAGWKWIAYPINDAAGGVASVVPQVIQHLKQQGIL